MEMSDDFEAFLESIGAEFDIDVKDDGTWYYHLFMEETLLGYPLFLRHGGFISDEQAVEHLINRIQRLTNSS